MKRIYPFLFFGLLFAFSSSIPLSAKPMDRPTSEEAVQKSQSIVLAEYLDYEDQLKVDYFTGIVARYKVIKVFKGEETLSNIKIHYLFHDLSACLKPKDWAFNKKILPQPNSQWVLFLISKENKIYFTYRGNYGRWPATKENLEQILTVINQSQ